MLTRKTGLLVMALIFGAGIVVGAVSDAQAVKETSNRNSPYLRMGTGARALGMGGAFVGVADDATANYWNPAGLAWTSGWEVSGMYSAGMNVDRTFNSVSFSRNGNMLAYGLQWLNAGMSDIPEYDLNGRYQGDFNYGDNAFSVSLAKGYDMASIGITGKYLRQSVGASVTDDAANGFGLDLGLGLVLTDYVRFGLAVQNIAGKLGEFDEVNTIPATLRTGVAVMPMDGLTAAFDLEKTRDEEDYRFHAGGEYALAFSDEFGTALRIGLNHDKFAGGIGLRYNFLTFDYAYVVEEEKFLGENHRFSVSLNFGREEGMIHRVADRDGDGIPDDVDQCPDLAEDFNGYQDSDGCPEGGPPRVETPPPAPAQQGVPPPAPPPIPTWAYINFKFGTAEISGADPIPVLEDVARIMKDRPDLRVKITGHTDNIGSDDSNMTLSMRRAEAIKTYLVNRGVNPERLLTDGKGESQPVDSNDTDIGRARNRRIEFSIMP